MLRGHVRRWARAWNGPRGVGGWPWWLRFVAAVTVAVAGRYLTDLWLPHWPNIIAAGVIMGICLGVFRLSSPRVRPDTSTPGKR